MDAEEVNRVGNHTDDPLRRRMFKFQTLLMNIPDSRTLFFRPAK